MTTIVIIKIEKLNVEGNIMENIQININDAKVFAFEKHKGQVRPNKNQEPKTVHLAEVASLVKKAGGNDIEIAAAFLHDSIEDTNTTLKEIQDKFNKQLASIVLELTDPPDFVHMELSVRKNKQAERIKNYQASTKLVKIADQISNVKSVYNDPPLDWDNEQCLKYAYGAEKIVQCCSGINELLEKEFYEIYHTCIEKYNK